MKLPLPPTGGQGGHYSFSSTKRPRVFKTKREEDRPERVPRRFRRLRLRRRRRSRMGQEHPGMGLLALALIFVPAALIFLYAIGVIDRLAFLVR